MGIERIIDDSSLVICNAAGATGSAHAVGSDRVDDLLLSASFVRVGNAVDRVLLEGSASTTTFHVRLLELSGGPCYDPCKREVGVPRGARSMIFLIAAI